MYVMCKFAQKANKFAARANTSGYFPRKFIGSAEKNSSVITNTELISKIAERIYTYLCIYVLRDAFSIESRTINAQTEIIGAMSAT